MAIVFSAYDRANGETVAIKLLNEKLCDGSQSFSDLKKQFADEARVHSLLSHPSIAAFKRACLDSSPMYFVMEYVDGITLKEYMRRNRGLTWDETINFSCRLLSALSHIHSKNIVHCDIKPQNILVRHDGSIKLVDFGIARMAGKLPELPKNKAVGTVQYVSPEQAEGKPLDHRSDVYSMGIMLYEMAVDRLPFNHRDPDRVAQMHSSAPPIRPRQIDSSIPKGLEQVILKAISKKPYMRFDSADEMRKYLELLKRNPNAVFRLQSKQSSNFGKYQPSSAKAIIAGVLAAFILVSSVAIPLMNAGIFRGADGKAAKMSVPDLWGYKYDDALRYLDEKYYDVDVIYSYNTGRRPGVVIDQYPSPGTRISVESGEQYTVTVTVSSDSRMASAAVRCCPWEP
jgi:serine/threonine-protein kinase